MNLKTISKRLSFIALAALFVLMTCGSTKAQTVLVGYDFTGVTSAAPPATFAPTTTAANVTGSSLTRGATAPASGANNSFRTTGFQNNGISTANTDYFQSSITANTGNKISLSSLTAVLSGTGTYFPATVQFAYSLDATNFTLIGSPQTVATAPATGAGQTVTVDLTTIAALQNVAAGTTVTFRFYASGSTTTGGFGFISPAAGTNGFAINGTASPSGATAAAVTIGGRALTATGRGIRNVMIRLTDGGGNVRWAITSAFGYYRFADVNAGETFVISAKGKRFEFAQPTQVLNVNEDKGDVNFVAY